MLLSVLIPFRDKPELLNACLASLAKFPFSRGDWEVLLIDNGSFIQTLSKLEIPDQLNTKTLRIDEAFNFQRLNNRGASAAKGRVLLLLNNDIEICESAFLDRLYDKALEPGTGAVGALLLYPDGTIQHGGVVVGLHRYAEHLYRGQRPEISSAYFLGPREDRPLSAVTAACLAVEKSKFDKIGGMDERFQICGGDVDLCLRLNGAGFQTWYLGSVSAVHHESKSRKPSAIPEGDFRESARSYSAYLQGRPDPFYPDHLSRDHSTPSPMELPAGEMRGGPSKLLSKAILVKKALVHGGLLRILSVLRERKRKGYSQRSLTYSWPKTLICEEDPIRPARRHYFVPHLAAKASYGGIATIVKLAVEDARAGHFVHFVPEDGPGSWENVIKAAELSTEEWRQIGHRFSATRFDGSSTIRLQTSPFDTFVATAWSTKLTLDSALGKGPGYVDPERLTYVIQDYEPLFYDANEPVEAELKALARKSYEKPCHYKINSTFLADYLLQQKVIDPAKALSWDVFEPKISPSFTNTHPKKKQIFVYSRPDVARNRFDLCVETLRIAAPRIPRDWRICGLGTLGADVDLGSGHRLEALGKLPFVDYMKFLGESSIALCLMESPHPSYPPLEAAASGAKVVCAKYANKDYSTLGPSYLCTEPKPELLAAGLLAALQEIY